MLLNKTLVILGITFALYQYAAAGKPDGPLAGTKPLTVNADFPALMVAGIDSFLWHETEALVSKRDAFWKRDYSSSEAYEKSIAPNREHLRRLIGALDSTDARIVLERVEDIKIPAPKIPALYKVVQVRWRVFDGLYGEGLLLQPVKKPLAQVVAIQDADQTPEMLAGLQPGIPAGSQFARRLAEQGCEVLIPVLTSRKDTYSGNPSVKRMIGQPHREWIYRASYEMGRHIIGYEVQKILAAVDYFSQQGNNTKIGIAGYGEGGLLALYSAALQPKVAVTMVSGYFANRNKLWSEPVYRNVFGLFREFGDAEIASLIMPRKLIVEYSEYPKVEGPDTNSPLTPGALVTPELMDVKNEINRANLFASRLAGAPSVDLACGTDKNPVSLGSEESLILFLNQLGPVTKFAASKVPVSYQIDEEKIEARQYRQVKEMERYTQRLMHKSERVRNAMTLDRLSDSLRVNDILKQNRKLFWEEVIGRINIPYLPLNPRTRKVYDHERWVGYEVLLDVLPNVFEWGYILVPKDLKPGERRPVVVCQHGLEGKPDGVIGKYGADSTFSPRFGALLADRGFVVFAPQSPFRGRTAFRMLQRKANPLGLSILSFVIAQHDASINWLSSLPFVDSTRIGFYGISYGGKAGMRIPAVLERYSLSVVAADFNDWIMKNVSVDYPYSYVFKNEWELPEWNLGNTFNHAEMASLIAPRPFMAERGHYDPVAPDWWVASEYAKVKLIYAKLGVPDHTEIEFFNGGHAINGVGSFKFLHKHLNWPEPKK